MQHNLQRGRISQRKALNLGLKQDHDKAAVKLNLAVCMSAKQDRKKAMIMIQEAKRLDTKGMLKNDIKQVESMIENPAWCSAAVADSARQQPRGRFRAGRWP